MKKKILLSVIIALCSIFILAGCKGTPVTIKTAYINNPTNLVFEVENENYEGFVFDKTKASGLEVFWIMSNNTIIELDVDNIRGDFKKTNQKVVDGNDLKKGYIFTYEFVIYEAEGNDNSRSRLCYIDVYVKDATAPATNEVVMVSMDILSKDVFVHHLGETFNGEKWLEEALIVPRYVQVKGELTGAELDSIKDQIKFVPVDPRDEFNDRYNGGDYQMMLAILDYGVEFSVIVSGGERPIFNDKNGGFIDIILVQPFGWIMSKLSFGYFALGILLTTLIIRSLAWPIYSSTNNMSFKMNLAQPDIAKLQRKYENRKDKESQQRMQMEMVQIYKKHKINFWGCLAPLVQFPIFSAMWQVVRRITAPGGMFTGSVSNTMLFGVIDLSAGTSSWDWQHIILVALVGISMIALNIISQRQPKYLKNTAKQNQQNQNPQAQQQQKTMKMMSYMMSIMMVFFSFSSPNAMAFYWIIGNTFSIAQNLLTKKLNQRRYEKHKEENIYGFELSSKKDEKERKPKRAKISNVNDSSKNKIK